MDYAHLTKDIEESSGEHGEKESADAKGSITTLVMQESQHSSLWAYAVEHKGAAEDWLVTQVLEDIGTIGLKNEKLVLKSDQETAVADVMRSIARERTSDFGTSLEQSAVGESDTNATIERAIQDFEGQARTLRVALDWRVQQKVPLTSPTIPWLIRHAAALITRCRIRPSGRTSWK